jgi:hypothetical protein
MDATFFIDESEDQKGPLSWSDLRALAAARTLAPEDLVWRQGAAAWHPAGSLPGLFENAPSMPAMKKCHPALAAVLSLFLPGLGHIFSCHQDNKGVFLIGFSLLSFWLTDGISGLCLSPIAALDAFTVARRINSGAMIDRWEFFPGIPFLHKQPAYRILLLLLGIVIAIISVKILRLAYGEPSSP